MIATIGLYGSFVLAAVGIIGIFLAGSGRKLGWAIGIGSQLLWLTFGIVTGQYGFILTAVGYGAVYIRNWLKWRREEQQRAVDKLWADYERDIAAARSSKVPVPPPVPPRTKMVTAAASEGKKASVEVPTGPTPPGGAQNPRQR